MMINQKNMQSGRSMIEMLGVLAIIGVLSVGGIAGYSKAMMKYKINKTVEQIMHISTSVRTLYGSQKTYTGLDTDVLKRGRLIPEEMWVTTTSGTTSTTTFQSTWGTTVNVVGDQDRYAEKDKGAFEVQYRNIPAEACLELAVIDWGSSIGSGLVAIGISQDTETTSEGSTETVTKPAESPLTNIHLQTDGSSDQCGVTNSESAAVACPKSTKNPIPMNPGDAAKACGDAYATVFWKFY